MRLPYVVLIKLLLLVKNTKGATNIVGASSYSHLAGEYKGSGECDKLPGLKGFQVHIKEKDSGLMANITAEGSGWSLPLGKPVQLKEYRYEALKDVYYKGRGKSSVGKFMKDLYDSVGFDYQKVTLARDIVIAEAPDGIIVGLHPTRNPLNYVIEGLMCSFSLPKLGSTTTTQTSTESSQSEKLERLKKRKLPLEASESNEGGSVKKRKTTTPTDFLPDGSYETKNVWGHSDKALVDISSKSGVIWCGISFHGSDNVDLPKTELEQKDDDCMYPKAPPTNAAVKTITFVYQKVTPSWSTLRICRGPKGGWELQMVDSSTRLPCMNLELDRRGS
ncbi:hypothetical protein FOL47_007348 [Perkinsus chesapeaki]|uniref:Uncharacterized protein n=1 Tax=Perkinsus chesapeaki TaxID=330153 RepID=A0A7J6MWM3_PERCH|nr:hypothetical protein FOL47_007348 [Perkinsus chesapeaki]